LAEPLKALWTFEFASTPLSPPPPTYTSMLVLNRAPSPLAPKPMLAAWRSISVSTELYSDCRVARLPENVAEAD